MEKWILSWRFHISMALVAAVTVAACGACAGIGPDMVAWRCVVAFGAVWGFQRVLSSAWRTVQQSVASEVEPSARTTRAKPRP